MIYAAQLQHLSAVLTQLIRFEHPADAALAHYFAQHRQLGGQDRALIAELSFACLRHLGQLSSLIAPNVLTGRGLALASLVRLYGVPPNQLPTTLSPVENTWLIQLPQQTLPDDLAVLADLPQWIIDRLAMSDRAKILTLGQALSQPANCDVRVNSLKIKRHHALEKLIQLGFDAVATPYSPLGIRIKTRHAMGQLALFKEGMLEVQDEGSQLVGLLVDARRGEKIIDFCAGAGGKTLQLGAQMASNGRLYALDSSLQRLAKLKPRLIRAGLTHVHPQWISNENDARLARLNNKIDRVLVDAPCSGLGTLRRHPDLKYRQTPQNVAALSQKQEAILNAASGLVKPGGRLVYATCSILFEENQQVLDTFLATHPEFSVVCAADILHKQHIALTAGPYLILHPDSHHTDGFFAAVLLKNQPGK